MTANSSPLTFTTAMCPIHGLTPCHCIVIQEPPPVAPDSLVARLRMVPHVTLCREAADRIEQLQGLRFSERNFAALTSRAEAAEARLARIEQAADAMREEWFDNWKRWPAWTALGRLPKGIADYDAIRAAKELEKR